MKKVVLLLCVAMVCGISVAQQPKPYEYVIIPMKFSDVSKDFNPYGISGDFLKIMSAKKIKSVFQSNELPSDPCNGLTIDLDNTSSMFRTSVTVNLKNCRNEIVWSGSGKGMSKGYAEGYSEAITEAMKTLNELPTNKEVAVSAPAVQTTIPVVQTTTTVAATSNEAGTAYKAQNMYYNDTYMLDVVDAPNGIKTLKVINGNLLGYTKLQNMATLTPSGIDNSYLVQWTTPQGASRTGLAKFADKKLTISLPASSGNQIIELLKAGN